MSRFLPPAPALEGLRAADGEQHRIERRRPCYIPPVALRAAEAQVGHALGQQDPAEQRAVALVAMDRFAGAGPDAVVHIDTQAVVHPVSALDEHIAAAKLVALHLEHAHDAAALARVDDVQASPVARERQAVRLREPIGDDTYGAAARI